MFKHIILSLLLTIVSVSLFAQRGERVREKVQNLRIAFYTQELEFSPEESSVFWPLFNQYQTEKREILKQLKSTASTTSDEEAEQILQQHMGLKEKELELYRDFINDLRQHISPTKILKISETETEFKRYLLQLRRQNRR